VESLLSEIAPAIDGHSTVRPNLKSRFVISKAPKSPSPS
jgi:hypothetical protein